MEWPEINHEKWLEKVKKELKKESLDSNRISLSGNLEFDPFLDPEEQTNFVSNINSFPIAKIGMSIKLSDGEAHQAIQHLLSFDMNVMRLNLEEDSDIEKVLTGVFSEMLFIDVVGSSDALTKALGYFEKTMTNDLVNISVPHDYDMGNDKNYGCAIRYNFTQETNPLSILHACKKDWTNLSASKGRHNIKIICPISENLLETIPFFRALRILFESILPHGQLLIECRSDIHARNEDLNTVLIKAGSQAMIAQMAGVDHLYFADVNALSELNHYTSILNIQNIMYLESHMNEVKDPLKGSFAIENLTHQILKQVQ